MDIPGSTHLHKGVCLMVVGNELPHSFCCLVYFYQEYNWQTGCKVRIHKVSYIKNLCWWQQQQEILCKPILPCEEMTCLLLMATPNAAIAILGEKLWFRLELFCPSSDNSGAAHFHQMVGHRNWKGRRYEMW